MKRDYGQLQSRRQGDVVPFGCEEACVLPRLCMQKPDSMAVNPAAKVTIPTLPTSAHTAKQAKNGRWTYMDHWQSNVL